MLSYTAVSGKDVHVTPGQKYLWDYFFNFEEKYSDQELDGLYLYNKGIGGYFSSNVGKYFTTDYKDVGYSFVSLLYTVAGTENTIPASQLTVTFNEDISVPRNTLYTDWIFSHLEYSTYYAYARGEPGTIDDAAGPRFVSYAPLNGKIYIDKAPESISIAINGNNNILDEGGQAAEFTFTLDKVAVKDITLNVDYVDTAAEKDLSFLNNGNFIIKAGSSSLTIPVVSARTDNIIETTERTSIKFSAQSSDLTQKINISSGNLQSLDIQDAITKPIQKTDATALDWAKAIIDSRNGLLQLLIKVQEDAVRAAGSSEDVINAAKNSLKEGLGILEKASGYVGAIFQAVDGRKLIADANARFDKADTVSEIRDALKQTFKEGSSYATKYVYGLGVGVAIGAVAGTAGLALAAAGIVTIGVGSVLLYEQIDPYVLQFSEHLFDQVVPVVNDPITSIPLTSNSTTFVHDVSSASGSVFALYEGLLGHAPDTAGGQSWVAALNAGTSLHDVTAAILSSPEAQARISASDNATYVDQLYETVLGRHADPDSAHSWVAALDAGTASRADVANALVFSDENVAQLQPALSKGVPVLDPGLASAERLYEALLHRDPDQTGLQNISDALAHGGSLHDVAQNILTSSEYLSAHPQLSDGQYVEALYQGLLDRAGDAASANSWVAALSNGTDRASVANAFLDSTEFQGHYANQSSAAYVDALYQHVFGHAGDASAVQSLASQLDAHSVSRIDVANSFTSSAEFQAHYPGSGDAEFVESLYHDALGRAPDQASETSWVYALSHGTSRADVALAIVDSPEAQQHLAAQVGAGLHVA